MDRRGFLKSALGGVAGLIAARFATGAPAVEEVSASPVLPAAPMVVAAGDSFADAIVVEHMTMAGVDFGADGQPSLRYFTVPATYLAPPRPAPFPEYDHNLTLERVLDGHVFLQDTRWMPVSEIVYPPAPPQKSILSWKPDGNYAIKPSGDFVDW